MIKTFPSVACVLHYLDMDAVVLVRQFRPAVYASIAHATPAPPLTAGFTYELCAGLLDKPGKSVEETLQEEVKKGGWVGDNRCETQSTCIMS